MKTRQTRFAPDSQQDEHADRLAVKARNKVAAAYDAELVRRFKAGDESAFTEIIERHYSRIRSLANQTLRDQSDAEEVAQDTFIRAHRALNNFRGDCSLAAWLYSIGLNLARNRYWFHFRRRRQDMVSIDRVSVEGGTLSLAGALADGTAAPRSESMTSEFLALVADCMARLVDTDREILTMRTALDLSYEEIATRLKINVGTVKSRVARARERLRELIGQKAPEFGRNPGVSEFFEFNRPISIPRLALA